MVAQLAETRGYGRASLLIVLAHPDAEIFHGCVLAHLGERGVRVTLARATDVEPANRMCRLSCPRLGIEEPVLQLAADCCA